MKHNQDGFSLVEGLLVIIALTLVVFTGFYIHKNQDKPAKSTAISSSVSKVKAVDNDDQTKGWKTYQSANFSVRYPDSWVQHACGMAGENLLLGPTSDTAGACQSDGVTQVGIYSSIGDSRATYNLSSGDYPDLKQSNVTIDGVAGSKQSGTFSMSGEPALGPQNGTKTTEYLFLVKGKTIVAVYTQNPDMKDVSAEFNTLVTRTLRFE